MSKFMEPAARDGNAPLRHPVRRGPKKGAKLCAASLRNLLNRGEARWAGKIPDPVRAHPLVRDLVAEMNRQRVCFSHLAARIGCARTTPSMWRYNRTPQIDLFSDACAALGLELAIVARRAAGEPLADIEAGRAAQPEPGPKS
jgi:hypothetical protein